MSFTARLRTQIKQARKRRALWVRLFDVARLILTTEGRSILWTRIIHRRQVHQTTPATGENRYPELFDLAASLAPDAGRILSFGCSTGEELVSIRQRFPQAEIVGAEINPRSRRLAALRVAADAGIAVVPPRKIEGAFDLVFALAVLQREPHKIRESAVRDISGHYPFSHFDAAIRELFQRLRPRGILCVTNAHYRVEDSSVALALEPISRSPHRDDMLFGPDGMKLDGADARTFFRNCI